MLSESEQLRSALLSSVSHDLRTPLVSIIGSATSLKTYRKQLSERDQNELIRTILEQGERLSRFVENLLNTVRMSHGGLRLQRDWCDISDIVGRAAANVGSERTAGRLFFDLPEDLPAVRVDPVLMEQVLINLLDNALRYSGEEGTVRVAAQLTDSRVEIAVSDEGPGIAEEKRDQVFDQFVRLGNADGRPGPGWACQSAVGSSPLMAEPSLLRPDPGATARLYVYAFRWIRRRSLMLNNHPQGAGPPTYLQ